MWCEWVALNNIDWIRIIFTNPTESQQTNKMSITKKGNNGRKICVRFGTLNNTNTHWTLLLLNTMLSIIRFFSFFFTSFPVENTSDQSRHAYNEWENGIFSASCRTYSDMHELILYVLCSRFVLRCWTVIAEPIFYSVASRQFDKFGAFGDPNFHKLLR